MKERNPFDEAVSLVSPTLRNALLLVSRENKLSCCEVRLRANRPVVLSGGFGCLFVDGEGRLSDSSSGCLYSSAAQVTDTFNRLCGYSLHSHQSSINSGYITFSGGHRAGIVGTAARSGDGELVSVRDVSGINLRVARECIGSADGFFREVFSPCPVSAIIAGPPSSGKTTVLRDVARRLSSCGERGCKVAVIDEREELAALCQGVPSYDLGENTDVLSCYPKEVAVTTAVRTMSPHVIVCDEVSRECELEAIEQGVNSGVKFVVSVHASSYTELLRRPQIERLLSTYGFEKLVLLDGRKKPGTVKAIYDTEELRNEIYRYRVGGDLAFDRGALCCEADGEAL